MEIKTDIKKKNVLQNTQKPNQLVIFAILLLIAISGMLLFNKILYDGSIYTYNAKENGKITIY